MRAPWRAAGGAMPLDSLTWFDPAQPYPPPDDATYLLDLSPWAAEDANANRGTLFGSAALVPNSFGTKTGIVPVGGTSSGLQFVTPPPSRGGNHWSDGSGVNSNTGMTTVVAWKPTDVAPAYGGVIGTQTNFAFGSQWALVESAGAAGGTTLKFWVGGYLETGINWTFSVGTTYVLTLTYDAATGGLTLRANGVVVGTATYALAANDDDTSSWQVGGQATGPAIPGVYGGGVVFGRVLAAAEIAAAETVIGATANVSL